VLTPPSPADVADLVATLHAEAPTTPRQQITSMLSTPVARRALITNLHAPSTET
jgi:hypothetical protein